MIERNYKEVSVLKAMSYLVNELSVFLEGWGEEFENIKVQAEAQKMTIQIFPTPPKGE